MHRHEALVPDCEPTVAREPRHRAFHHPPVPAQLLPRLDPSPRDAVLDRMVTTDRLTEEQAAAAKAAKIVIPKKRPLQAQESVAFFKSFPRACWQQSAVGTISRLRAH